MKIKIDFNILLFSLVIMVFVLLAAAVALSK
jgi:hypothetical protein